MAIALTPGLRRELEAHRVGHLATADSVGVPHLVPVTFAISGDTIVFVVDEKPKRNHGTGIKRVRNILANPTVAFLVDRYDEDWDRLAYVLVRGRAAVVDSAGPDYDAATRALRSRYPQYRTLTLTPSRNPVIQIIPEHVHRWHGGRRAPS